jgi:hypothetical protein
MPFPIAPTTTILEAMKAIAQAADIHLEFGEAAPFKIRHWRHKHATKTDRPAVSLRLVTLEQDRDRGLIHSHSEICWSAVIDIIVDLELPPESSGDDPTGWNRVSATANRFASLYLVEDSPLRLLVDDILPADADPDEDSTPDEGRLALGIVVLYRTLWNDLNHLLSPEENA